MAKWTVSTTVLIVSCFFCPPNVGTITSVTNLASSISRNMDRLSLDTGHRQRQEESRRHRPSGLADGLRQGLTGFGISLLGGSEIERRWQGGGGREREKGERETHRERERERDRQTDRQRERERHRQRQTDRQSGWK